MSRDDSLLPSGFQALEPFVELWAVEGTARRAQGRTAGSEASRIAFYNVAKDMAADALDYLDRKPIEQLEEKDRRLMNLLLSLCHVSLAVEIQGDDEPQHTQARQHMRITRSTADHSLATESRAS
jgi:hypothetical protein